MDYSEFTDGITDDAGVIDRSDMDEAKQIAHRAACFIYATVYAPASVPCGAPAERVLATMLGLGTKEYRSLTRERRAEAFANIQREFVQLGVDLDSVLFGLSLTGICQSLHEQKAKRFKELVGQCLRDVIAVRQDCELLYRASIQAGGTSRTFPYAVQFKDQVRLAVVVAYARGTDGTQKPNLQILPLLQEDLEATNTLLLTAVDGPGIPKMRSTISTLISKLCFLANGESLRRVVEHALETAAGLPAEEISRTKPHESSNLDDVTTRLLGVGLPVSAETLGMSASQAAAFLNRYAASHPDFDLEVSVSVVRASNHTALALATQAHMGQSRQLNAGELAQQLADHLGRHLTQAASQDVLSAFGLSLAESRLRLPEPLPLLIRHPASDEIEFIEAADEALGGGALVARTGVIVDLFDSESTRRHATKMASLQRSQFAVLGVGEIRDILLHRPEPALGLLIGTLLSQVDLRIISPFVPDGPTPAAMFFGREREMRRVAEGIARQSYALVGGRKVGKTSMLRRLEERLSAGRPVAYVDCQAHTSREDFIDHLTLMAGSAASTGVRGAETVLRHFAESRFGGGHGVLLLDEVDQLFWEDATASEYPHIISSALRSLSQQGELSIVATGERQLFELTKKAESPHWNFCTPIRIGSLGRSDAKKLLVEPLEGLGISLSRGAVSVALEQTACHPNLVQYLGDRLVSILAEQSRTSRALAISASVMEELTYTASFRERFTTTFWSRAHPLEKLISVSSATSMSALDWSNELRRLGVTLDFSEVKSALDYLELCGVLVEEGDGLAWPGASFKTYLGAMDDPLVTDQWIGEIHRAAN